MKRILFIIFHYLSKNKKLMISMNIFNLIVKYFWYDLKIKIKKLRIIIIIKNKIFVIFVYFDAKEINNIK